MEITSENAKQMILSAKENKQVVMLEQAKKNAMTAGVVFVAPSGAMGITTGKKSDHNKPTAFILCMHPSCSDVHLREQSDWHQCRFCNFHKKSGKSRALPEDVKTARALERKQEAEKKAEDREKTEAEKAEAKRQARLEEIRKKMEAVKKLAAERGVSVSTQTILDYQREQEGEQV